MKSHGRTYKGKESEKLHIFVCVCVYIYIYIYIYLNHFTVHLKLIQHCKLTIVQLKK